MQVLIFAAGSLPEKLHALDLPPGKILCADGGARFVYQMGIMPDLVLGDFDSLDQDILDQLIKKGVTVESHPPQKDYTDLDLLLQKAILLKPEKIFIWGALGARWDHSLANLQLLEKCARLGVVCHAYAPGAELSFLPGPNSLTFNDRKGETVSLLSLTPKVEGINLQGFFYPLENATLHHSQTMGISNIVTGNSCSITFKTGILLTILQKMP